MPPRGRPPKPLINVSGEPNISENQQRMVQAELRLRLHTMTRRPALAEVAKESGF